MMRRKKKTEQKKEARNLAMLERAENSSRKLYERLSLIARDVLGGNKKCKTKD